MRLSLVLAVLLISAAPAWAHAILTQSDPAPNGRVRAGTATLTLRYNSRIDRARSRLTLNAPDHSQKVLAIEPNGADEVLATTTMLTPGEYVLRWQVLAVDGHITRGDLPFTVTER